MTGSREQAVEKEREREREREGADGDGVPGSARLTRDN